MVGARSTYFYFILFLFIGFISTAQKHLITDVRINKNTVYVGEPVEVSVSVYTSTWFTKGVNPGNIKVNDAFTVYFRSLSNSKQINGQTYAGVTMTFNVFPYDNKDIIFPSMEFTVETPNNGDYKGVKRLVKTPSRTIKVKPVPLSFNRNEWLVTSNMTVNDAWSGNKNEVKVGDVLERRISRNVAGTVAELIPPIIWDTIANVSLYPTRVELNSNKTKTSISASRIDGTRYLFEKEGDVIIPEKELTWWNPRAQKLYKRTLPEHIIHVLPNPDLGMLETMRDSLQVSIKDEPLAEEDELPLTIIGLTIKEFMVLMVALLVLIYFSTKIARRFLKKQQLKNEIYKASEAFYFKKFITNTKKHDSKETVNALYQWIDKLDMEPPTIDHFVSTYGEGSLDEDLCRIMEYINNEKASTLALHEKAWSQARLNFLKGLKNWKTETAIDWVNP